VWEQWEALQNFAGTPFSGFAAAESFEAGSGNYETEVAGTSEEERQQNRELLVGREVGN